MAGGRKDRGLYDGRNVLQEKGVLRGKRYIITPARAPWRLYHYSMVGVVRCGNQKIMATLDSLLLCGAYPYVEGCH